MGYNKLFVPGVVSGGEEIPLYKCHQELFVVSPGAVCWCFLGSELDWRSSGGFLVHTASPGHQQLPCNSFVSEVGLKIHGWGPKPIYYFASLSFLWV